MNVWCPLFLLQTDAVLSGSTLDNLVILPVFYFTFFHLEYNTFNCTGGVGN